MKYTGSLKIAFKEGLSSKALVLMWILSKPIMTIVVITVWTTVYNYSGQGVIGGFTLNQTINYMIFSFVIGALAYAPIGNILGEDIKNGNLSIRLTSPIDYGLFHLAHNIGNRLYAIIFEVLPGLIIATIFFGFHQYNTLMTIASLFSIFCGLIINYFISIIWSLMYFKTTEYGPFERIKNKLINFLAGWYIPLNFLPPMLESFFNLLPFKFITYIPARIFINSYSGIETIMLLLTQVTWIAFLYALYKVGWYYSIKEFSGVGV